MLDRCDDVQPFGADAAEAGEMLAWPALRSDHHRDARLVCDAEHFRRLGIVERDVHAVRLLRPGLDFAEDAAEVVDAQRPRREHAHAAGVRHRGDERRVRRRPAHRRLENGVLNPQQSGNARFHFMAFSIWMSARASLAIFPKALSKTCASLFDRHRRNVSSRSSAARMSA